MNYNEFQETLLKELESRLDSHISLNPITTTKNNNTLKHGIEFSNDTSNISPVLYLDEWYEFYLAGKSLSQIAEDIVELYHQAADVSFTNTEMLLDYEKLQEKILYKLVNFKANQSVSPVHHRMPLILDRSELEDWVYEDTCLEYALHKKPPQLARRQDYEQQSLFLT